MRLTAEQRYRQAVTKDRIIMQRNMRLWLRDEILYLPAGREREFVTEQIEAAYQSGLRDATQGQSP